MNRLHKWNVRVPVMLLLLLVLGAALTGCNKAPGAEELLTTAAQKLADAETVQFAVEREGAAPEVDLGLLTVGLLGAQGAYQSPDTAFANVSMDAGGTVSEAEVLWTGGEVMFRFPPLINSFTAVDLGDSFNPPDMFAADSGVPKLLEGLDNVTVVGEDDVDGVAAWHITGSESKERVAELMGFDVPDELNQVQVWVDRNTGELLRVRIDLNDGSAWVVDFFGYGEPVEIPSP